MSGESSTHLPLPVTQQALRDMIENVPGMIYQFVLAPEGQLTFPYVSRGSIEIYGRQPEEIMADAEIAMNAVHPHDVPLLQAMLADSAESLSEFRWTGRVLHADGKYRWIKALAKPERLPDHSILWNGYLSDVTARMEAQDSGRKSQAMLACLHQAQTQFITALDKHPVFEELLTSLLVLTDSAYGFIAEVQTNSSRHVETTHFVITSLEWDFQTSQFHGKPEMPGETLRIETLFAPFGIADELVIANDLAPLQQHRPLGYSEMVSYLGLPLRIGAELVGFIGIANRPQGYDRRLVQFVDPFVSTCVALMEAARNEQRRTETELQLTESRHFLSRIADTTPEILYIYDIERGCNVYSNREVANALGYSIEEIKAFGSELFPTLMHPDDIHRVLAHSEAIRSAPDGTIMEIEYRMRHRNGDWHWFLSRDTPFLRSKAGVTTQILGTALDITERKQLQIQVLQTEKLAALGELVAGVAHEINNPLTAISGHCQLLEGHSDPRVQKKAAIIVKMADRAAKIVRSLLSFARSHGSERRLVSLNELVETTLDICQYKFQKSSIELCKEFAAENPVAYLNENQIEQVLLNLLNNAEYALRTKSQGPRQLTIATRTQIETDGTAWGVLSVSDTGEGIPDEILPRIFDPFFTTKDVGEGTGLGLSVCHGIMEAHSGVLEVETQRGIGTTFTLKIPMHATRKKAA